MMQLKMCIEKALARLRGNFCMVVRKVNETSKFYFDGRGAPSVSYEFLFS